MRTMRRCLLGVVMAFGLAAGPSAAFGYDRYSVNGDATNCRACHGDFRAASYTSLVDNVDWGNLHNLHRQTMLAGDCDTCHGGSTFPVMINSSTGGTGLPAIACVGCHGRAEDDVAANPDFGTLGGYGAGLRQHHYSAGVTVCSTCHQDANPANYTPVGEQWPPPYYGLNDVNHPALPIDPCNADTSEDFAGTTIGLDNDGDDVYDLDDSDCAASIPDAGVPDAATTPDAAPPDAEPGTPDAAPGLPDAGPGAPDAGDGGGDEGGGCCRTSRGGFASSSSLALIVMALLWRRRRR